MKKLLSLAILAFLAAPAAADFPDLGVQIRVGDPRTGSVTIGYDNYPGYYPPQQYPVYYPQQYPVYYPQQYPVYYPQQYPVYRNRGCGQPVIVRPCRKHGRYNHPCHR